MRVFFCTTNLCRQARARNWRKVVQHVVNFTPAQRTPFTELRNAGILASRRRRHADQLCSAGHSAYCVTSR